MNERILELAKHASKLVRIEHPELYNGITMKEMSKLKVKTFLLTEYDVEKFAELIVRECMKESWDEIISDEDIAQENDPLIREYLKGSNQGIVDAVIRFRNHFGVEE